MKSARIKNEQERTFRPLLSREERKREEERRFLSDLAFGTTGFNRVLFFRRDKEPVTPVSVFEVRLRYRKTEVTVGHLTAIGESGRLTTYLVY